MGFIADTTLGGALLDKNKGTIGNRLDCEGEKLKNHLKGAATSLGMAGVTLAVLKNDTFRDVANIYTKGGKTVANKIYDKIMPNFVKNTVGKIKSTKAFSTASKFVGKTVGTLAKGINKVCAKMGSKMSKNGKIGLAVAAAVGILATTCRTIWKDGKISQKYDDIAKSRNNHVAN